jgi:transcriptional regulator with XRE-family HTH domain
VTLIQASTPAVETQATPARRRELAAFLRSRRGRISPEAVGLIPGPRRHTPGLRREEVAQLASVGLTWYTWLEQGRPINASVDVLDAIARALRFDATEREHLYRLADVAIDSVDPGCGQLEPEVQTILDGLVPLPASVLNARYDMLAWNGPYAALFPGLVGARGPARNVLWQVFTMDTCPLVDSDQELPRMVATLRGAFGRHVGEPAWTEFVRRLSAASPRFAELWARHDVAEPGNRIKRFFGPNGEEVRFQATSFAVTGSPEVRMIVYTPLKRAAEDRAQRQDEAGPL